LFRYSQFLGHALLAAVLAAAALDDAEQVNNPPLGLCPFLDKPSDQAEHSFGIGAGQGSFLGVAGYIHSTTDIAGDHRQWDLARRVLGPVNGLPGCNEAASGSLAGRGSGGKLHRADPDAHIPMPPSQGMQCDIHYCIGIIDHTLEFIADGTFKDSRSIPRSCETSSGTRSTSLLLPRWSIVMTYMAQP